MKAWFKFLKIALPILIAALLALGISNVATTSARMDRVHLACLVLLFLFPAVLCSTLWACRDGLVSSHEASIDPSAIGPSAGSPAAYSLHACLFFWVGWFAFLLWESRSDSDNPKDLTIAFLATLIVIILIHILVAAHSGTSLQSLANGSSPARVIRRRVTRMACKTEHVLQSGARILQPTILIGLGSLMVLAGPLAFGAGLEDYKSMLTETWITAEYGLSEHLDAVKPAIDLLGRGMFVGVLVVAVVSLGCILCGISETTARLVSRARPAIAWAAGVLGVYSILDLYFGWVGFLFGEPAGRVWLWLVFGLAAFYFATLVALAATAAISHGSKRPGHSSLLMIAIALFSPLLCANTLLISPFLPPGFIDLRGMAMIYLGIQFLCWGWVGKAFPHTR
jgi:hypothetical protein